jgi:propanol-preferring alcohol dehydrogenase
MKAMVLDRIVNLAENRQPLRFSEIPVPEPQANEILIRVTACGVCHTELDEIEGRTPPPQFPMILGHQVVGRVKSTGKGATRYRPGDRVGVGWIFSSCGQCEFCRSGNDNLCPEFLATGRDVPGGYAQFMIAHQDAAFPVPNRFTDAAAAPLLCAGAIGYRSLRLTDLKNGQNLGLTGFGASAHLVLKMAQHLYPDSSVFVFARSPKEREFALELGAKWAGNTDDETPEKLHAVIDTTPVWKPVVEALKNLASGGRLVINAIRKEETDKDYLLQLDYPRHLWMEKEIKSVANVARRDIAEFLPLAEKLGLDPEYREYPLDQANTALLELKNRKIRGAKVLVIGE